MTADIKPGRGFVNSVAFWCSGHRVLASPYRQCRRSERQCAEHGELRNVGNGAG